MKKNAMIILCIAVCLCASFALAGGMDGLTPSGANEALLDPASLMNGVEATVLKENYAFYNDYVCTAYTYPMPLNVDNFLMEYRFQVKKLGYSWKDATIDGMDGSIITAPDGLYAMLVPYFNGDQLLLLVENGLAFNAVKRTNYLDVVYNGSECTIQAASHGKYTSSGYELPFYEQNGRYFESIVFYLPPYADVGDEFYIHGKEIIDGFSVMFKEDREFDMLVTDYLGIADYRQDAIEGEDYFLLEVTGKERTSKGICISGTFEGRFVDYYKSIGWDPIYFEDGVFSTTVPTK